MMKAIWVAYAVMNVFTFALYGIDKYKAMNGLWRISEAALLLATWLMGGVGAFLGMQLFRHKTQHTAFVVSAPAAAVLSLVVMALLTMML